MPDDPTPKPFATPHTIRELGLAFRDLEDADDATAELAWARVADCLDRLTDEWLAYKRADN